MPNEEMEPLEKWLEVRFADLNDSLVEINKRIPELKQELDTLSIKRISIEGGLVELKKVRKGYLGISDKPDPEEAK